MLLYEQVSAVTRISYMCVLLSAFYSLITVMSISLFMTAYC